MKKQLLSAAFLCSASLSFAQLWTPFNSNLDTVTGIRYMSAVDSNTVWAIGYDGNTPTKTYTKFTRTVDGQNFKSGNFYPNTTAFNPSNISAVDTGIAFIAAYANAGDGTQGQILKTVDGGLTWNNVADTGMYKTANNFPNVVHFWDANNGWTMGDPNNTNGSGNEFEIWTTQNGGTSWSRVNGLNIPNPLSGEYGLIDVYTTYGNRHIWFGTNKGRVFRSTDAGLTWNVTQLSGIPIGVSSLSFRDSLNGMVFGVSVAGTTTTPATYAIRVTKDGGATFTSLTTTSTAASIGTTVVDNIPGTNSYMTTGRNLAKNKFVTSITKDDGLTWIVLEEGSTLVEFVHEMEVTDSLHAWGGQFSDETLPFGIGGMSKYSGPSMHTIGLQPVAQVTNCEVYPNPTSGLVNLNLKKIFAGTSIIVTDVLGKIVYSTTISENKVNESLKIDLSGLSKGIYLLNLNNGKETISQKVIID